MSLFACAWVPDVPLAAALRAEPELAGQPLAVVDDEALEIRDLPEHDGDIAPRVDGGRPVRRGSRSAGDVRESGIARGVERAHAIAVQRGCVETGLDVGHLTRRRGRRGAHGGRLREGTGRAGSPLDLEAGLVVGVIHPNQGQPHRALRLGRPAKLHEYVPELLVDGQDASGAEPALVGLIFQFCRSPHQRERLLIFTLSQRQPGSGLPP